MSLPPPPDPVPEDGGPAIARVRPDRRDPTEDGCTFCGLPRAEHGVRFLHRFVRPGVALPTR